MEVEAQYKLHGQMTRSSSYLLQCLAGLRRYKAKPSREIIDEYIPKDSIQFIDSLIDALEEKPVSYNVALVYRQMTADKFSKMTQKNLKNGLLDVSQIISSIKSGQKPQDQHVESALRFLIKIIPTIDTVVADLGKRLYGSWISGRERS